jgi:hypothetical protein
MFLNEFATEITQNLAHKTIYIEVGSHKKLRACPADLSSIFEVPLQFACYS